MPHLSIVTPVYKAEGCLDELYRRLVAALEPVTKDFEIVMVEDCGGDRSWEIIRRLAAADPRVKGLQFSRNFGQHYGITAGLDVADGDWVVVMDCDLQDRPEDIPRLYAKAREGFEVVIAQRSERNESWLKSVPSWMFYKLFSYLADTKYDWQTGNFRIISRRVVENFRQMREQLRFFGGMINWMGFRTTSERVERAQRADGRSAYTYVKLWRLAIDIIIAYSDKPLRMAIRLGFVMSGISFVFGVYFLMHSVIYGSSVVGWPSLIVSIYFIGGIIVSILGIIGIYLGKTFDEAKKRPLYIVQDSANVR